MTVLHQASLLGSFTRTGPILGMPMGGQTARIRLVVFTFAVRCSMYLQESPPEDLFSRVQVEEISSQKNTVLFAYCYTTSHLEVDDEKFVGQKYQASHVLRQDL